MSDQQLPKVAVLVDNVDPDNLACALAAASPQLGMELVGVFVAGRPANRDPEAALDQHDPVYSAYVLRRNAAHMKGFMSRAGHGHIPVFETQVAPNTLVPHAVHIDERILDLHGDMDSDYMQPDGGLIDGVRLLAKQDGPVNLIVGGPLTDVSFLISAMLEEPGLQGKLGIMTAQLAMLGLGTVTVYGGGSRQFNLAADPVAAHRVLMEYPNALYMVPTDYTKAPGISISHPNELAALNVHSELVEIYRAAYPVMMEPRGEPIFIHDLAPVLLMAQLLAGRWAAPAGLELYDMSSITIEHVPHTDAERDRWGEIDYRWGSGPDGYERHVVRGQNRHRYRDLLTRTLTTARLDGEHYYVTIERYSDDPVIGKRLHSYTVCMKGGHSICQHGWPKAIWGCSRNGREIIGLNPEHAARDDWAYHKEAGEWVPAFDHDIPLGACCKTC